MPPALNQLRRLRPTGRKPIMLTSPNGDPTTIGKARPRRFRYGKVSTVTRCRQSSVANDATRSAIRARCRSLGST